MMKRRSGAPTSVQAALLLAVLGCCMTARADRFAPPEETVGFKGEVEAQFRWLHNSNRWALIRIVSLTPAEGSPDPQSAVGKEGRLSIGYLRHNLPNPQHQQWLRSLKRGDTFTIRVEGTKASLRLRSLPAGWSPPKARPVKMPEGDLPVKPLAPSRLDPDGYEPGEVHTLAGGEKYRYALLKHGQMENVMSVFYHPNDPYLAYMKFDVSGLYRRDAAHPKGWVKVMNWMGPGEAGDFAMIDHPTGVALDPADADVVYYAANHGLYRSTDRGKTAVKVFPPKGQASVVARNFHRDKKRGEPVRVDPFNSGVVYFGTQQHGFWRTMDGGATWAKLIEPAGKKGAEMLSVAVASVAESVEPSRSQHVYVGVWEQGVYESRDGGETFELLPGSPKKPARMEVSGAGKLYVVQWDAGVWRYDVASGKADGLVETEARRDIAVSPGDEGRVLALGGDFLKRSTDHGDTWETVSKHAGNLTIETKNVHKGDFFMHNNTIALHPDGRRAMVGNPYKVFESQDVFAERVEFVVIPEGADAKGINTLLTPPADADGVTAPLYFTITDHTLYRMDAPDTAPATSLNYMSSPSSVDYSEEDPAKLWATNFVMRDRHQPFPASVVSRTRQGGVGGYPGTFFRVTPPFDGPMAPQSVRIAVRSKGGGEHALVVSEVGAPTNLRYTLDGGRSWNSPEGEVPPLRTASSVWPGNHPIAADRVNGDYYAYGSHSGAFHRSRDGGKTWQRMAQGLPRRTKTWESPVTIWYGVEAVPGKAGHVLLCLRNQVMTSTDGGTTWAGIEGFENIRNATAGPPLPGDREPILYVFGQRPGDYWGVYRSKDYFIDPPGDWERLTPPRNIGGIEGGRKIAADRQTPGRVYIDHNAAAYVEPVGAGRD